MSLYGLGSDNEQDSACLKQFFILRLPLAAYGYPLFPKKSRASYNGGHFSIPQHKNILN